VPDRGGIFIEHQATIRSPRAEASAASHLMAVYAALETS
jgi:hypothetical protein